MKTLHWAVSVRWADGSEHTIPLLAYVLAPSDAWVGTTARLVDRRRLIKERQEGRRAA